MKQIDAPRFPASVSRRRGLRARVPVFRVPATLHALAVLALALPALATTNSGYSPATALILWIAALSGAAVAVLSTWRQRRSSRRAPRRIGDGPLEGFDVAELGDLLELSSDWLWKTDRRHRYTHLTAGLRHHSTIDPQALLGHAPWEVACGDVAPGAWESYRKCVERRVPVRITMTLRDRPGAPRHIELLGKPVFDGGVFAGYHGLGRDVTRAVDTERALHENHMRYQELIESINEVVFRADAAGRLTFLNPAWEKISGYTLDEALDTPLADYVHPDERAAFAAHWLRVARGEEPAYAGQLRLRTHEGETRWLEVAVHPLHRKGAPADANGLAGTLFDITARKIAEVTLRNLNRELEARVAQRTAELQASNHELQAFSYSISHDLRTPLRAIDGFAHILEEELAERLDDEGREHIQRIRNASRRMAKLIDDLLKLAHLARQPLHTERIDLSDLAARIVDELRAAEPERDVIVDIEPGLAANADRGLMQIVLENLLGNAWKFCSRQARTRISLGVERSDGREVFCVADNGAGFDMAFAHNLFRPFHRLHTSAEFSGSGIGLANAHRIITRHGGQIWATSKPGEGTRFYFTLGDRIPVEADS